MSYPLVDFIGASLIMGIGIGADVAIATMLQCGQLKTTRMVIYWVLGVSLTHTLFPMLGYLFTYFSIQLSPTITPLVGLIAFGFIAKYLFAELSTFTADCDHERENNPLSVSMGLILAVSWDALWSGPAKSAQVIGWPELLVWLSFVLVGVIVSLCAMFGLGTAKRLANLFNSKVHMHQYFGMCIQYSVIGYFGVLALCRYTLAIDLTGWHLLIACVVTMSVTMESLQIRKKLVNVAN